jgi:hypothetical protein
VAKLEGRVASADSELRSAMDRIIQLTDERDALRELAGELIDFCDLHAYGNGRVMGQSDVADDLLARAAALGVG